MSAPVEFSVWAPVPERVRVQVDGTVHDLRREDAGWWRAEVEARPEADYGFLLDDNETPRPDPRSRRAPDGVDGLARGPRPGASAGRGPAPGGRGGAGRRARRAGPRRRGPRASARPLPAPGRRGRRHRQSRPPGRAPRR